MMFALPADAAVRAERSLREFVQTLTKTFADLPIGLAIFDQSRKLQLFNPSLIDLTRLPTGFLTARPTLFDYYLDPGERAAPLRFVVPAEDIGADGVILVVDDAGDVRECDETNNEAAWDAWTCSP